MKLKLSNIATFFFSLTVFFIPFDGEGIIHLGEFSSEAYILFLLIFLLLWLITKWKQPLLIPKISWEIQILLLFLGILVFSSLINIPSILENSHPKRTGLRKLIGQLVVLFFFFPLVTVFFYDFFRRMPRIPILIRKVLTISLYVVFGVGFFEVLFVIYGIGPAEIILDFLDNVPLVDIDKNTWAKRISSLTKEPPSLGMFLCTTLPWILAFKPKKYRFFTYYFPLFAIVFLTFYSGSRSGMFIILLQFLAYFFLKFSHRISAKKIKIFLVSTILFLLAFPIVVYSVKDLPIVKSKLESFEFLENYKSNTSNKTRLGTYLASFETIKKNPIFGIGYGQAGFYVVEDYPAWAAKDNPEIVRYQEGERFPPMFNIYLRILTETGFLGLLTFLCFLGFMLLRIVHWWYKGPEKLKNHYLVLALSLIGFGLTWVQFDTIRVLGFWVFFGFYLVVYYKTHANETEN